MHCIVLQSSNLGALSDCSRVKFLLTFDYECREEVLYHPPVDANGDRQVDKVEARLCVDWRTQLRNDYRPDEMKSPTACIFSIFARAQIAAAQDRFVMICDAGSAYLNADMPIEPDVANEIVRQDKTFSAFQRKNGCLVVRLNKALYGCIESAKLWYKKIAGTLNRNGFTANPRDP